MSKNEILVVIDPQRDFIFDPLGTPEAREKVNKIIQYIKDFNGTGIVCTLDTHYKDMPFMIDYSDTIEGQKIPVEHCIYDTEGFRPHIRIAMAIDEFCEKTDTECDYVNKTSFGSWKDLPETIDYGYDFDEDTTIKILGYCTDLCVLHNAIILRAAFPSNRIEVIADACAGSTPEKHERALGVLEDGLIEVNRDIIEISDEVANYQETFDNKVLEMIGKAEDANKMFDKIIEDITNKKVEETDAEV